MSAAKTLRLLAIVVVVAAVVYVAFDYFVVDHCLDSGGRWNWSTFACEGGG